MQKSLLRIAGVQACGEGGNIMDNLTIESGLYGAVESLLAVRENARKEKRYADSDKIRKALADAKIIVEDSGSSSLWRRG